MMKKLITAIILAIATPSMAQNTVSSFFPGTSEGITYFLPDTKIDIKVEAICVTHTPGEFHSYAERFLHTKNAISEPGNHWEITGFETYSEGVPCKEKSFIVRLDKSKASCISLNSKGIISTINTFSAGETNDGKEKVWQKRDNATDASRYMTEEMLTATSTAKMAELTAKEIYAIRESRFAITRGQAENMPSDGAAISLLLEELDRHEKALTEMFVGRIDTVSHSYSFSIAPDEICDTTRAILFRFSHKLGILDKENLAGDAVYYDIEDLKTVKFPVVEETVMPQETARTVKTADAATTAKAEEIVNTVQVAKNEEAAKIEQAVKMEETAKAEKKKEKEQDGIRYNIPGRASLHIYSREQTFVETEIAIAQFGITETLSKTLFSKKSAIEVVFDTTTGGIISLKRN